MGDRKMQRMLNTTAQDLFPFIDKHQSSIIFLLIFLLNLLLVSPQLMPAYSAVNPDDEAKYVDSGWRLLRGDIRDMAWGPIVALVYAPVHLIIGGNPDWFLLELWIGRFLMFAFLWWSIFYLAHQLKENASPHVMAGLLFINTPLIAVLVNQSDAVLVGFSCLALASLLKYYRSGKPNYLSFASLFVGLGVLTRVETMVLFVTLIVFSLIIRGNAIPWYKKLLSATWPMCAVIGLYFIVSIIWMGKIDLGVAYKSYDSFEMNQSILTGGDIALARQETRRLFGTSEENQGSILRAIMRNPAAFALRIFANAKTIPVNYLDFFGKKLGPIVLIFAAFGVYSLIRKKDWMLVALLLIWPLHVLVALGFLALHIIPQTIYLPLLLGAIGITEIFKNEALRFDKLLFLITAGLLFVLSWITNKPAFLIGFLLLTSVLVIHLLANSKIKLNPEKLHFSIFLLLAAGLILREPYPFPNYPSIGKSASERAIHYLEAELPVLSTVLVPSPLPAIAARMSYITMDGLPADIPSITDFAKFLHQNNVQAVYLDSNRRRRDDIYDLMEQGVEKNFTLGYISQDTTIRVFLVK